MPSITLYVKEADVELVNEAKAALGDSLSSAFIDCLREKMDRLRAKPDVAAMEKITLEFWRAKHDERRVYKSFIGRWLVGGPDEGERADADAESRNWDADAEWSVAQTSQGKLVVYSQHSSNKSGPEMDVYDSFDEFKSASDPDGYPAVPANVIAAAAAELDQPYEIELDI